MLTKLRRYSKKLIRPIVNAIIKCRISANTLTLMGLAITLAYLYTTYNKLYVLSALIMLIVGFIDVLDGEVARITNTAKPSGAYLDSVVDRIEDGIFILGFLYLNVNPALVSVLILLSLMTSYCRARSESLGVPMEGIGIIERGERVLLLTIAMGIAELNVKFTEYVLIVLLILSAVTLLQRVSYGFKNLRSM